MNGEPVWSDSGVEDGTSTRTEADGANRRRAFGVGELELQRARSPEGSRHVGCCTSEDGRCPEGEMGKTEGRQEDGYGSGSVQFTKVPPTSKKYPILIDQRLQTANFASEFHTQFTSSSVTDFSDPHSMWMVMTASQPEQRACPTPDICMRIVIAVSAPGSQSKPQLGQVIFIRCLLYKAFLTVVEETLIKELTAPLPRPLKPGLVCGLTIAMPS